MKQDLIVSIDTSKLDLEFITHYLSNDSYWAKGRSKERILTSIKNSFCFGIYLDNQQIGFARVVTDFSVFAWVMDVFILPTHQGNGYGTILMDTIINHSELRTVSRWGLNTLDAHELYTKFGFSKVENSELYMEKLVKQE